LVLTDVIVPIFFIIFLGILLRGIGRVEPRPFARAQLYVLSPALAFMALTRAEMETILVLRVLLFVAILAGIILGVSQGVGFLMKGKRIERQAFSMASVFMNSGFYGIPVCLLAFGDIGLVYATTHMVTNAMLQATLGIFLVSAGRLRASEAFLNIFRIPMIYAIVSARLLAHFDLLPSEPFMKMISLIGQAAIPVGLLLLGMQLHVIMSYFAAWRMAPADTAALAGGDSKSGVGVTGDDTEREEREVQRDIIGGVLSPVLRLGGGFVGALLILRFFDFDPLLGKILIVQSAMPTAVHAVVYATEFDCRPRMVAVAILSSTLLSILSVTLILGYLG